MTYRLLVTGSRHWRNVPVVESELGAWWDEVGRDRDAVLVHGSAAGLDSIAATVWQQWGLPVEPHPANWRRYGRAAGPNRNQEMVDLGADVCLAFPLGESRGTRDCMRRASEAGIPVIDYDPAARHG